MRTKQDGASAVADVRNPSGQLDLLALASDAVLSGKADVTDIREKRRTHKIRRTLLIVALIEIYFAWRVYDAHYSGHFSLWIPGL